MDFRTWFQKLALGVLVASSLFLAEFASAADGIKGQVLGGDAPIANSTVTLWGKVQTPQSNSLRPGQGRMGGLRFMSAGRKATPFSTWWLPVANLRQLEAAITLL